MRKNRIVSAAIAAAVMTCSISAASVFAEEKDQEIVYREYWTSLYYVDIMENPLPYLACQADVYRDGTVKFYFWNTYEWDKVHNDNGYHYVEIGSSIPYPEYEEGSKNYGSPENAFGPADELGFDLSYYPACYESERMLNTGLYLSSPWGAYSIEKDGKKVSYFVYTYKYSGALSDYKADLKEEIVFTPKKEITDTCNFHLFGKDIEITPELLAGEYTEKHEDPVLTQLIEENKKLRRENDELKETLIDTSILRYDINADGVLDASDASMILTIYALNSTGADIKTTYDYYDYLMNNK